MPSTWEKALSAYRYPVILGFYENAHHHPGWFTYDLSNGDLAETTRFESHFRKNAAQAIEPWLEVVFWKLFSQPARRNSVTKRIEEHFQRSFFDGMSLWNACKKYVENPSKQNFETFQSIFGFASNVIAVAATFPAFVSPETYPMVDTRIAKWVGTCMAEHNMADPEGPQLTRPSFLDNGRTVLTMSDFGFMQDWIKWCDHTARKLKKCTLMNWRSRDVEMAVFNAWGGRRGHHPILRLNPLPNANGSS